jgi:hypothetical protein
MKKEVQQSRMPSIQLGFRCPENLVSEIDIVAEHAGVSRTKALLSMIDGLPGLKASERSEFPECEAIYLVWTEATLLYIGQTGNLKSRFVNHHRLGEFLVENAKVSWFGIVGTNRLEIESSLIKAFCPDLNGKTVKSFVGKKTRTLKENGKKISAYLANLDLIEMPEISRNVKIDRALKLQSELHTRAAGGDKYAIDILNQP